MKASILSMGAMYADINCPKFPYKNGLLPNQEIVGDAYEVVPGGSALNFARVCAGLDLHPVFVGKIGKDKMGRLLKELLSETGVTPALIEDPQVSTMVGMNFIGEDESSIMTVVGSASQSFTGEEMMAKIEPYLDKVGCLYIGGCFKLKSLLPFYPALAEKARQKKVKVALDHGRITNLVSKDDIQAIKKILSFVDYYLPNKEEFLAVWSGNSIDEAVAKVRKISKADIVVKDAENGAVGFRENKSVQIPCFKIAVINTIGAGDSFNAGFIKAQSLDLNFRESIRFGSATAALKISEPDLPTLNKIETLLKVKP